MRLSASLLTGRHAAAFAAFATTFALSAHAASGNVWLQSGHDAEHSWFNAGERSLKARDVPSLTVLWSAPLGQFYVGPPTLSKGRTVLCSNLLGLAVVGANSGRVMARETDIAGDDCGSPALAADSVYVTSTSLAPNAGYLTAFSSTGEKRWTAQSDDPASLGFNNPTVSGGSVYVADHRYAVYAFDAATGAKRWGASTRWLNNEAAVGAGKVVVTTWTSCCEAGSKEVVAFDPETGETAWTATTDASNMQYPATIGGGLVFTGSDSGAVHAFDASTGTLRWRVPLEGYVSAPLAHAADTLFVVHGGARLSALDMRTGALRWTLALPALVASNLAIANDVLYFTATDRTGHHLAAVDAITGTWIDRSDADTIAGSYAKVIVAEGRVQIATSQGVLYAYGLLH